MVWSCGITILEFTLILNADWLTSDTLISFCKQIIYTSFWIQANTKYWFATGCSWRVLYMYVCVRVCKKVSLFIHFFQPNQNGLSANKFNSMLYQLHFKPVQMFCFWFPVTIQLNLYYMWETLICTNFLLPNFSKLSQISFSTLKVFE